jgi:hypothetical protein
MLKYSLDKQLILDDQVFFAPREIFDKAGSKRSVERIDMAKS